MTVSLLGINLTKVERSRLEVIADSMEAEARSLRKEAVVFDKGNNEVPVADLIFAMAWEIKQIARYGTPSQGI